MEKVAAITGAYGGLGAALSIALAKRGWKLVLGGRNKTELEKFTKEVGKITEAVSVLMDVRKKKDCEMFVKAAVKRFGKFDLLVNNAGIWRLDKIEDVKEEDIREMFETNVYGPIFCAQAAVPIMKEQKSGHILNIGSSAAVDGRSGHVAYTASKSAVVAVTSQLRNELEGTGIIATVFSPERIRTELFRTHPERLKFGTMEPDFVAEKIVEHIENPVEWHVVLRRPK